MTPKLDNTLTEVYTRCATTLLCGLGGRNEENQDGLHLSRQFQQKWLSEFTGWPVLKGLQGRGGTRGQAFRSEEALAVPISYLKDRGLVVAYEGGMPEESEMLAYKCQEISKTHRGCVCGELC